MSRQGRILEYGFAGLEIRGECDLIVNPVQATMARLADGQTIFSFRGVEVAAYALPAMQLARYQMVEGQISETPAEFAMPGTGDL